MKSKVQSHLTRPSPPAERATPKPGEVWSHYRHGKVKIIRPWNAKESVCELMEGNRTGDRALLMNGMMRPISNAGDLPVQT